ncbi:Ldh family oxidoreductase [Candidatus Bathyarchaeota archaeon]|nr:Ldh family oxidoreductase [Candidatus Bathyarchaeota archaeon]
MPVFSAEELFEAAKRIFEALGAPEDSAAKVAEHLVEANLMGHDSHGVVRILRYLEFIREGKLNVKAKPQVVRDGPTVAIIDGKWGFGQVAAYMGMELAIKKAERNVFGAVGILHCNHIGRLGAYAQKAAEKNLIGIVACNASPAWVAPYGGKTRMLGTNPISIAIPTGGEEPFLMDFATSIVAEGKVRVKFHEGRTLPEGWVIDKNGRPTTNPGDLYDGGAILPFGGHKGYAISLAVDLICGALTGAGCMVGSKTWIGNGVFMLAIDVNAFTPLDIYTKRVRDALNLIRSSPPAEGFERVMVPGEPEFTSRKKRLKEGVPIPDPIWDEIKKVAEELGVDLK